MTDHVSTIERTPESRGGSPHDAGGISPEGQSYWGIVWRQFRGHKPAVFGLAMVAILFLVAILAPFITNKYPYYWYTAEEGLSFPLFSSLTNADLIILMAFVFSLLLPVTMLILRRGNMAFWQLHPIRRAFAANLTVFMLVAAAILVVRVAPGRVFKERAVILAGKSLTVRVERDFRDEVAGDVEAKYLFPPIRFAPTDVHVGEKFQAPGSQHLLGTDRVGRSNIARVIYGARISLAVGFIAVAISVSIGVLIGGISAYFGGWVDIVLQRIVEIFICFPSFFLLLTIIALYGPKLWFIMIAIGLTSWTGTARLIRSGVLQVKQLDYVMAARAGGLGSVRIVLRHALPNTIAPVLVSATFGIASAVTFEVSLSFLGLGDPDSPSWGLLLQQVREVAGEKPILVVIAAVPIFFAVLAYNLIGEGLRDAIDPRLKV